MFFCPIALAFCVLVIVTQTESYDLLFDFLQSKFVVISHTDEFFDLLIDIRRNMDWTVVFMGKTPCDQHRIPFICFDLLLTLRLRHGSGSKNNTIYVMLSQLVV